uniref:Seven TM Receptor n=1 Tax=Caenorhabditis tropicalis TaxID=1561998 RepID=A0A1I7SYA6_9PELO
MSSLTRIQHTIQQFCTPLAFSINSLLIQLILYKSPKRLGVYKYLMIYIALFEMLYSALDILAAPDFYSYDSAFLVITLADKVLVPRFFQNALTVVFCSMFGTSMAMFGMHFVYRYLVLTGESYLLRRDVNISDLSYISPNYWIRNENGENVIHLKAVIGMCLLLIMVSISMLSILVFATLSYRNLGSIIKESANSTHYRTLQLQLLNSLVAQALIPALLMQGPSCIVFTVPFFHMGTELSGGILGITVSLYPVLDPLPTMFVIKHYRHALTSK